MRNIITLNELFQFLHTKLPYQQNLVYSINDKGLQVPLSSSNEIYQPNITIKIEGIDKYSENIFNMCKEYANQYNHIGPVTCHAFLANADAPSFDMHTDPDDVILLCCEGTKTYIINGDTIILNKDDHIFIPNGTPHKAINTNTSLILSFGLEKYLKDKIHYELDVLPKNN